ncbi:MAG: TetR/AcrR family transcriptional regulator [Phycisphaerales bacterium]|nr:MAG: TetR/AcrR family transcriptional regulator [Phycisphaerales bacterium]
MTADRMRRGRPKDKQLAARRRAEILDTAAKLFAERGYPNTDVQVVADELRLGKGTVYRYFPTKRELFLAAVDRGMSRLHDAVEARVAETDDPVQQIAQAMRAYLAFFDNHPEIVELLIQERAEFKDRKKPTYFEHRDANIGRWQALLRRLTEEGRVRDIPVERITDVVGDLLYGTLFTNHFAGRRKSLEEQARDILDIVFEGILCRPNPVHDGQGETLGTQCKTGSEKP